ncbi:MAG: EamA family transporter [Candidatus Micrarchaeaceae archaeon]
MRIKTKAISYLLLSLFTGALMPIMLDLAKGMNLFEFFMLTYLIATPFALLITKAAGRRNDAVAMLKDKKMLGLTVAVGLLSYLPIGFFIMFAERFVSASLATVVFRTSPLLMLIFLPILLKERLSINQIAALLLAFVGIFIAMSAGGFSISGGPDALIILFLAFGALAYALGGVLAKRYMFDMASGISTFNISLFVLFAALFAATGFRFSPLNLAEIIAIVYVAVANNVIGFYTYFIAFRSLKTTLVTNTYFFSPFLTFLFAGLILGEAIKVYYIIIALLVIAGLLIQRIDVKGGTYAQKQKNRVVTIFDVTSAFTGTNEPAIYDVIKSGGRVLAIKMRNDNYNDAKNMTLQDSEFSKYGAVIFGDGDGKFLGAEEKNYVREMLGAGEDESVIMGAGKTDEIEELLTRIGERIGMEGERKAVGEYKHL